MPGPRYLPLRISWVGQHLGNNTVGVIGRLDRYPVASGYGTALRGPLGPGVESIRQTAGGRQPLICD